MESRKGHYSLYNILKTFDHPVTYTEVFEEVSKQGWLNDFLRMGQNSIIRAINNHNKKYNGNQFEYD